MPTFHLPLKHPATPPVSAVASHSTFARKMRPLLLLYLGLIGCSTQSTTEDARKIVASGATVSVSRDAAVSNAVGSREHKQFVRAIIESANLELDLPDKVKGTPYAMEHFSMSQVAPEAFSIVSRYPDSRDGWIALSKVYAYGDGEYASSYQAYEAAARREFPTIFFGACPDWESLSYKATRAEQ